MTRVALYARYSSDNQRDASIEDQFRICRERTMREKWTIVNSYKDAGISGASMILRPGIQALLQDAQSRAFDIVLAEALDRISRDQADVATLFKQLRFAGVPIVTLAEGEITELHVGLKGTECSISEGPRCEDAPWFARSGRGWKVRWRALLRIPRYQTARRARRSYPGRPRDRSGPGRRNPAHLSGLRRWHQSASDRGEAQCRRHSRP